MSYKKTPDLKAKYEKDHKIIPIPETRTVVNYEEKKLQQDLKQAEDHLRNSHSNSQIEKSIEKYMEIRLRCLHYQDSWNAIYFNHKCINLTKRYNLIKPLIHVLITMGDCFAGSGKSGPAISANTNDLILSMIFKEESKTLVNNYNDIITFYSNL